MAKSNRMRRTGHVARMGRRGIHIGLLGMPEGKIPLSRTRCRWLDNIKMDFGEIV
jgi:hypothetical protein